MYAVQKRPCSPSALMSNGCDRRSNARGPICAGVSSGPISTTMDRHYCNAGQPTTHGYSSGSITRSTSNANPVSQNSGMKRAALTTLSRLFLTSMLSLLNTQLFRLRESSIHFSSHQRRSRLRDVWDDASSWNLSWLRETFKMSYWQ